MFLRRYGAISSQNGLDTGTVLSDAVGLNGFAVDIYACIRKTGTDNQIAVSGKRLICNGRGLFGSQSLFCSVFFFAFSPTTFFSWQGN